VPREGSWGGEALGAIKLVLDRLRYRVDHAGIPKVLSMQIVAWVLLGVWVLGTAVVLAVDASQFHMLGIF
jgi:hypothetical protein